MPISKIPPPCAGFQGTHKCSTALCADSDTDIQSNRETTMGNMDVNTFKPFIKILLFLHRFSRSPSCQLCYVEVPCAEIRPHWLRNMKIGVRFIYAMQYSMPVTEAIFTKLALKLLDNFLQTNPILNYFKVQQFSR